MCVSVNSGFLSPAEEGREVSAGEKPPLCIKKGKALSEEWKIFFFFFFANLETVKRLKVQLESENCRHADTHTFIHISDCNH